jgi:hypothetical protein
MPHNPPSQPLSQTTNAKKLLKSVIVVFVTTPHSDEGADILILARTDARQAVSLEEALARASAFADAGADLLFIDALESVEEMRAFTSLGGAAAALPKVCGLAFVWWWWWCQCPDSWVVSRLEAAAHVCLEPRLPPSVVSSAPHSPALILPASPPYTPSHSLTQMANMLEGGGKTPILPPEQLQELGFKLVSCCRALEG